MTARNGNGKSGGVVAGVDAWGDHIAVVVARSAQSGVQVVEAKKFSATDAAGVGAMCERLKVTLIVRAAPSQECVARIGTVPSGDAAGMLAAAGLLAEGEFPDEVPAHRRAGGLLPDKGKSGVRDVLLTAWLGKAVHRCLAEKTEEAWVTPIAAVAALRGTDSTAALVRRAQGTVSLLMSGDERTVARVVVEDGEDDGAWSACVTSAVEETRELVGAGVSDVEIAEGVTLSGGFGPLQTRVQGARTDEEWLGTYAIALGSAMVALDQPSGLGALAYLHADAPKEQVPPVLRLATWISRPAVAWGVGIAAAVILFAGPWALARERAHIASVKAAQLDDAKSQTKDLGIRAAVYEQVNTSRLPMTKLLADIAGATPVGVTIEDMRIMVEPVGGQVQGTISLRGVASSRELVNQLEKNLSDTKLFKNLKQNRNESKAGGGAEFDISAVADKPQVIVRPLEDFAAQPLAVRLHGPGASNTAMPVGAKREAPKGTRGTRSSSSSGSEAVDLSRRPAPTASAEPPPALTDAEINAMDSAAAMKGWTTRRSFIQRNSGIDPTVKQRLEDEITKLRDRQKKAQDGGEKK